MSTQSGNAAPRAKDQKPIPQMASRLVVGRGDIKKLVASPEYQTKKQKKESLVAKSFHAAFGQIRQPDAPSTQHAQFNNLGSTPAASNTASAQQPAARHCPGNTDSGIPLDPLTGSDDHV
ncbi:hypothetical protein K469DRAFT_704573 [Zopfia rhizophila CBS 207.26]|uniref:Uncharacterized protein n=1 Tax=Zopfia rhizophila CBS 207.26 TaxID=1314779 RepID=A0A6A6EAU5_9PEZI|nr:hypothetical protein K469DRAFT_704573 [Zopfia rhizophila CBS 207.26]